MQHEVDADALLASGGDALDEDLLRQRALVLGQTA